MTHGRARRVRLAALAAGATVVLGVASGCAGLPSSTTPQVIDVFAPSATQSSVPTPVPDQEPDLLVRDFLKASGIADQRHAAARQFLTPRTAASWDDTPSTTVVLRADVVAAGPRTEDRAVYALHADKVGTLDPGGIYREETGRLDLELQLQRVDGQWRIDELPAGVVLERSDFFANYTQSDLYFLSSSRTELVPDPRWTSVHRQDLGYALVNLLANGPRAELTPGVTSRIPTSVTVRPNESGPGPSSNGTTIDFQGLPVLGSQETREFAAQVVWTLAHAGVPAPYRLERGGSPVDERHADGWNSVDVAEFAPGTDTPGLDTTLTAADGLVRVGPDGVRPAGTAWSAVRGGRGGALSRDGRTVAVVTGESGASRSALLMGPADGAGEQVLEAGSLTVPSFEPVDGAAWLVVDGRRLVGVRPGGGRQAVTEYDESVLRSVEGAVTDLKVDGTGSRFALVARGGVYVGTIRAEDHRPMPGTLRRIGRGLHDTARSVAWLDPGTVAVGRDSAEAPVVSLSVDGALTEPLSQRNIAAPVDALATAGKDVYAVDQRSLLRLDTAADTGERYWREVPGLAAIRAYPVVRG